MALLLIMSHKSEKMFVNMNISVPVIKCNVVEVY